MKIHASTRRRSVGYGRRMLPALLLMATASMSYAAPLDYLLTEAPMGQQDVYHSGEVIAESELATMRGGFNISGLDLNFGAKIRTMIDNKIQYETVLNFTEMGANIVSETLSRIGGDASNETQVSRVESGSVNATIGAISNGKFNLSGLNDFSGIVVSDAQGGTTAALHSLTKNAIVSALVSDASGRSIQQNIDISISVENFSAIKSARQQADIMKSLQNF